MRLLALSNYTYWCTAAKKGHKNVNFDGEKDGVGFLRFLVVQLQVKKDQREE